VKSSDVELQDEIGQGAFGKVWKGQMKTTLDNTSKPDKGSELVLQKCDSLGNQCVAVKTLHGN